MVVSFSWLQVCQRPGIQAAPAEYTWAIIITESDPRAALGSRGPEHRRKRGLARGHPAPRGGAQRPNPGSAPPSPGASAHPPPPPPLPPGQKPRPARVSTGVQTRTRPSVPCVVRTGGRPSAGRGALGVGRGACGVAKSSRSGSRGPAAGAAGPAGAGGALASCAVEMMTICEESSSRSAPAPSRASSAGAHGPPAGAPATAMALTARAARVAGGGGGAGPWLQAAARARSRSAPGRRCLQSPGHFYAPNPFCRERATSRGALPSLAVWTVTWATATAPVGCSAPDRRRWAGRGVGARRRGQSRNRARAGFVGAVPGGFALPAPSGDCPYPRRGGQVPAPTHRILLIPVCGDL